MLAISALILTSVVSLGWTGALFSDSAPPQTTSLTAGGQSPALAPASGCPSAANLSFDPYLKLDTQAVTPGAPAAPFEPLLASASSLVPNGSALPAGTTGLEGSTTGVTGFATQPVNADAFAAGYCDETELSQFDPASTPACPGSGGAYSSAEQYDLCALDPVDSVAIPAGAVAETAPSGYLGSGVGLPFVAVYPLAQVAVGPSGAITFSGSPVVSGVPVSILYPSYSALPSAFGADQPGSGGSFGLRAVITFSLATYVAESTASTGPLSKGTTYVAYLLVQDTNQSGPLADHLWYFVP
ncbi:MAG: hypothetical protein M0T72_05685 [Candidatus Dormibacteraeota bacterium]|nr:hypothetical protein [Candidatus Dormibacteraeota bacterium]